MIKHMKTDSAALRQFSHQRGSVVVKSDQHSILKFNNHTNLTLFYEIDDLLKKTVDAKNVETVDQRTINEGMRQRMVASRNFLTHLRTREDGGLEDAFLFERLWKCVLLKIDDSLHLTEQVAEKKAADEVRKIQKDQDQYEHTIEALEQKI
jgi:hypothetical protein